MTSFTSTTTPLHNKKLSNLRLLPTLSKRRLSTNNMLKLSTTKWRISTSQTTKENGLSPLITRKLFLINGLLPKPTILKPDKNLRKTSLTPITLSEPKKLLSKPPLKLNGHRNSKLTNKLLLNLIKLRMDQQTELTCTHLTSL